MMIFFIIKCLLNEDRDIAWNFILVHLSFTIVVYNYLKPYIWCIKIYIQHYSLH